MYEEQLTYAIKRDGKVEVIFDAVPLDAKKKAMNYFSIDTLVVELLVLNKSTLQFERVLKIVAER